jgi:hypothetical protein
LILFCSTNFISVLIVLMAFLFSNLVLLKKFLVLRIPPIQIPTQNVKMKVSISEFNRIIGSISKEERGQKTKLNTQNFSFQYSRDIFRYFPKKMCSLRCVENMHAHIFLYRMVRIKPFIRFRFNIFRSQNLPSLSIL